MESYAWNLANEMKDSLRIENRNSKQQLNWTATCVSEEAVEHVIKCNKMRHFVLPCHAISHNMNVKSANTSSNSHFKWMTYLLIVLNSSDLNSLEICGWWKFSNFAASFHTNGNSTHHSCDVFCQVYAILNLSIFIVIFFSSLEYFNRPTNDQSLHISHSYIVYTHHGPCETINIACINGR